MGLLQGLKISQICQNSPKFGGFGGGCFFQKLALFTQKLALFRQKTVLFIQNSVKKSKSTRSDFFQPAKFLNTGLLLISRETFRGRQGRGVGLWPMMKRSLARRKIQRRPQRSRARFQERRQRPGQRPEPAHNNLKTEQSGFPNQTIRLLQPPAKRKPRGPPCPGRLQHLIGVLQDSRTARGGGSNG
jgi:hypothetical protein